ncbi:helix-turn-helix domain-containing protein [Flavobacterium luminosum]|uniref:Helix-turn-helix domain-containing protein n=1 Tax=Flavobacterium luminosum TaxID=2949086 RepID=A0ABT0TRG1_9FLAO|nr:helix-turn-helix transcriptional regulator [Flavobacterium sp. HXWNR70]MCL9810086.1 helix-turn-helix domain-containing protein [Flavobacterium sp. HXWNR70]
MKIETYKKIIQKGSISDELEFEKALILERKLRLLSVDNPEYKEARLKLRQIIKEYEKSNWSSESEITDEKIKESDNAEFIAEQERIFILKRKQIIKEKLTDLGLNQQDLGSILGHNKTYISELMNGINPFTLKDLIIIHRLFKIKLENLIPTTIPQKERGRIKMSILKINKPKLKLDKRDIEFA